MGLEFKVDGPKARNSGNAPFAKMACTKGPFCLRFHVGLGRVGYETSWKGLESGPITLQREVENMCYKVKAANNRCQIKQFRV